MIKGQRIEEDMNKITVITATREMCGEERRGEEGRTASHSSSGRSQHKTPHWHTLN